MRWLKQLMKRALVRIARYVNGEHTVALIAQSSNGLFAVDIEDFAVGRQLRTRGTYALTEVDQLKPHLSQTSRLLVVGAHIGSLAVPLSKLCREVVAIEANPKTFELLQHNIALNRVTNCCALNIAASDREEVIPFLLSRTNSGGSKRLPKTKAGMYYEDKPQEVSVQAYSLDAYLDDLHFDVIVMDIEGSEYFALRGMQKILAKASVLVVEFLPHHLQNVSGVSVEDFMSTIEGHFTSVYVPTKNQTFHAPDITPFLRSMYDDGLGDDGLIFTK